MSAVEPEVGQYYRTSLGLVFYIDHIDTDQRGKRRIFAYRYERHGRKIKCYLPKSWGRLVAVGQLQPFAGNKDSRSSEDALAMLDRVLAKRSRGWK